jgi:tripartite-type tricarboxylate transporter receptor subunit TctC
LDIHSQLIGDRLSKVLGQPILREHKPGAGGTLGASLVAKGKPDGYMLYPGTSSSIVLATIVSKLDYKLEDFISIGTYARAGLFIVVTTDSKYKTLNDLIDDAKKNPGKVQVGSFGKFTTPEIGMAMLNKQAGIKLNYVPFKATAEVVPALLGGHVDAAFLSSTLGQLESGTVRLLAYSDYQRTPIFPDVKTFKELGYPISLPSYYAMCVSSKTPKRIVDKLNSSMQEVFKRHPEELTQGLKKLEHTATFLNSQESMEKFREDYKIYLGAAKEMGWEAK